MAQEEEEVRRSFVALLRSKLTHTCTWYKCTAVDVEGKTCTILYDEDDNLEIDEIMLGFDKSGNIVYPKTDKDVLVIFFDGSKTNGAVIMCEETDHIDIMGDEFGGLPIAQKLMDNYNKLKDFVEALADNVSSGLNSVGESSSASGSAASSAFDALMLTVTPIQFEEIENEKVKHGKGNG